MTLQTVRALVTNYQTEQCHNKGDQNLTLHSCSFFPVACAECNDSLLFSGASSIPLCYALFSFHPSPPTILLSSLTSSCHVFLGLLLNLVVSKFMYNTFWGILFSSTLCTCPNQRNLFNLIVSVIVDFLTIAYICLLVNILQFSLSLSYTGSKILLYTPVQTSNVI